MRSSPPSRNAAIATGWSSSGALVACHGAVGASRLSSPSTTVPPPGSVATRSTAAGRPAAIQRVVQSLIACPAAVTVAVVEAIGGGHERGSPVVGDAREVRGGRRPGGQVLDVPTHPVAANDQPVATDGGALERVGGAARDGQQRRFDRQVVVRQEVPSRIVREVLRRQIECHRIAQRGHQGPGATDADQEVRTRPGDRSQRHEEAVREDRHQPGVRVCPVPTGHVEHRVASARDREDAPIAVGGRGRRDDRVAERGQQRRVGDRARAAPPSRRRTRRYLR